MIVVGLAVPVTLALVQAPASVISSMFMTYSAPGTPKVAPVGFMRYTNPGAPTVEAPDAVKVSEEGDVKGAVFMIYGDDHASGVRVTAASAAFMIYVAPGGRGGV